VTLPVNPIWPSARASVYGSRKTIWGDIAALKACDFDNISLSIGSDSGLSCWRNNTKIIGQTLGNDQTQLGLYPKWSTYPGEENILFGICLRADSGSICNINTSTGLPSASGTNYRGYLVTIDTSKNPGDAWYIKPVIYVAEPSKYPQMEVQAIANDGRVIVNLTGTNSNNFSGTGYKIDVDRTGVNTFGTPVLGSSYTVHSGDRCNVQRETIQT